MERGTTKNLLVFRQLCTSHTEAKKCFLRVTGYPLARVGQLPCCFRQHVRLPPRGVCRFLCWHVLKLEFWHFARPKLNLGFVFASVFAVFSSKKCHNRRAALSKNMLSSPFRIVFFRCFPVSVAFRIGFCSVLAISRLSAHAGFHLHLSFNSVRGFGGRPCDCDLCFLFLLLTTFFCYVVVRCSGGEGGGWTTSCGKKQQPQPLNLKPNPAHAYETNMQLVSCTADADSDVADVAIVSGVISGYLLLGFHTSTMQKPRIFAAFQTKTSKMTLKLNLKKARKALYLRHFRKNATTKQERRTLENENTDTSCC